MTRRSRSVRRFFQPLAYVGFLVATLSAADGDDEIDANVRQLVDTLASANKAPPKRDGTPGRPHPHRWPADYEFSAQKAVYDAGDELLALGADAIPELLRHLKDERYSVTERSGTGATANRTVGYECSRIFGLLVQGGSAPLWEGRGNPAIFTNDEARWWEKNGHRPLWEIQLEFVEKELESCRQRLAEPPRDFQPDIKRYIRGLEANQAKLKETHQPIIPKYPRTRMLNRRGD